MTQAMGNKINVGHLCWKVARHLPNVKNTLVEHLKGYFIMTITTRLGMVT